ncbi:MAG: nitroreductase family protein [Phycisphaeraceae bacterium]|nr:nitroreductase family protein [Phycisphaeraceae bacterium]
MRKDAPTEHPVHELVRQRWSPLAFDPARSIDLPTLASLFEAARWSPSAYNEQPWAFIYARREDAKAFDRIISCLVPGNQTWAKRASVIMITAARQAFERNGKPNRHAGHDIGQAAAWMTVQAESVGLRVHQMAGIDPEKCRTELGIPAGWDALTAIAIGFPDSAETLPPDLQARETAPRSRKPMSHVAHAGTFDAPPNFAG